MGDWCAAATSWSYVACTRAATDLPSLLPSRYNKLAGSVRQLAHRLSLLPAADPFRHAKEADLLSKLYDMGILNLENKLSDVENKVSVSGFCRRRLAVVVCRMRMAETVGTVRPLATSSRISHTGSACASVRAASLILIAHPPPCSLSRPSSTSSRATSASVPRQ